MHIYKLPTLNTQADAVILANGEFPSHQIPLSILKNSPYIVCCDGAIDKLASTTISPHAIVGDCDSLSLQNREKYATIIHQVKEQETNDLTKSVHFCIQQGKKNIIILGATGNREDHAIANISLLSDYVDITDSISIISDYGIFDAIGQTSTFESYIGQQVSIFSLMPTEITSEQLKYPICNRVFTSWWQATLNECISCDFTIRTTGKLIIFRSFDKKH